MALTVRILLSGPKTKPQGFSFEIEDGTELELDEAVLPVPFCLGTLRVRDGAVQVRAEYLLELNGSAEREFPIRQHDRLRSGPFILEFTLIEPLASSRAMPQQLHTTGNSCPEIPIPEPSSPRIQTVRGELLHFERIELAPPPNPGPEKATSLPGRTERKSKPPRAAASKKTRDRIQILGIAYLSTALSAGAARLGNPLLLGLAGVAFLALLAGLFHRTRAYTGLKGTFQTHFRKLCLLSGLLLFWGLVARFSWILGIFSGALAGAAILVLFTVQLSGELRKATRVAGWAALIPALLSLLQGPPMAPMAAPIPPPVSKAPAPAPAPAQAQAEPPAAKKRSPASAKLSKTSRVQKGSDAR